MGVFLIRGGIFDIWGYYFTKMVYLVFLEVLCYSGVFLQQLYFMYFTIWVGCFYYLGSILELLLNICYYSGSSFFVSYYSFAIFKYFGSFVIIRVFLCF